jgi:hypothetical protein
LYVSRYTAVSTYRKLSKQGKGKVHGRWRLNGPRGSDGWSTPLDSFCGTNNRHFLKRCQNTQAIAACCIWGWVAADRSTAPTTGIWVSELVGSWQVVGDGVMCCWKNLWSWHSCRWLFWHVPPPTSTLLQTKFTPAWQRAALMSASSFERPSHTARIVREWVSVHSIRW